MSAAAPHCPVCSRVLYFTHAETNLLQCSCRQTIVRDGDTILPQPFYVLSEPADFIQPGTAGDWDGKTFRVLGRVRAWFEESVFNYWTIVWPDGGLGYLGEGYGLFAIYSRVFVDGNLTAASIDDVLIGADRELFPKERFVLERKSHCNRWELEGEAWLPIAPSSFRSFEFAAHNGRRIEAIAIDRKLVYSFEASYTTQDALQLKNTRQSTPPIKTVRCEHCQTDNRLKAFPFTQSFACTQCGTRHALEEGSDFKQTSHRNKTDTAPDLPLGSVATFDGVAYELIGFIQKQEENKYAAQWKEYTLFNSLSGFLFLSEFDGHWIKVAERGSAPVLQHETTTSFTYGGERFELYNKYNYDVVNASGEFPYNAFNEHESVAYEFISPPEVWIREKSGREGINWFLGTHLSQSEVTTAFDNKVTLPIKSGVGAIEPKGYVSLEKIVRTGFGAILFLLVVHLFTSLSHRQQRVLQESFSFTDASDTVTAVTRNLVFDKWRSNLELDVYADVDNSWAEVGATLVDAVSGTEYSAEEGVEYYHGYAEGEYWTEGSRRETLYLSQIPAGRYNLILRGLRERKFGYANSLAGSAAPSGELQSFAVTAKYDTSNDRNIFFCLLPVILWPIIHFLLVRRTERKRWHSSPFSPYTYNDE